MASEYDCLVTWNVLPEAAVSSDHPLGAGLGEDDDILFGLVLQLAQTISEIAGQPLHVRKGLPLVFTHVVLKMKEKKNYMET